MVRTLQQLPTDTVATAEELQKLTAHELKERLTRAGVSCSNCLEKDELVRMLLEVGGSSAGSCCICCEDYASGDVVRVLPCKVSERGREEAWLLWLQLHPGVNEEYRLFCVPAADTAPTVSRELA